jgi:hypothetical protein
MFEKPQKDQVVRTKIEGVSLDSASVAPTLDGTAAGRSATVVSDGRDRLLQDYTSVCSAISSASSTSIPRYLTVLSSLCPAGHRLDYLPCRTMSRRASDCR